MRLWRICREPHAANTLSGRDGLVTGGRWHPKGRRIVYTSGTLSLAALEILVHTDEDLLPFDLVHVEIQVPDTVKMEQIAARNLPSNWRNTPAPPTLQRLGADWIDRRVSAVLIVPSAVVPQEHNYLLNPEHADAMQFRIMGIDRFLLDPRLRR